MGPGRELTDQELLDRLLHYGTLTLTERRVFSRWLAELRSKARPALTDPQRLWVKSLYIEQRIGAARAAARSKAHGPGVAGRAVAAFDALPRPLKPPGK